MYVDARDVQPEDGETSTSQSYLEKLADRGGEKLLSQLRTGSIEFDVDDDTLQVGDVLSASLPQLGYTAMVRVADIITRARTAAPPAPSGWARPAGTRPERRTSWPISLLTPKTASNMMPKTLPATSPPA